MAENRRYKFMTNVIQGAMHQTRYMKSLEKITMDAQVSYQRLFISLGGVAVASIVWGIWGLNFGPKFPYVALPATVIYISVMVLLVNFLISSRTKSMLLTAGKLAIHPYLEGVRQKSKTLGNLKTVGIKNFKKGVITFTNGDKGLMYEVDGQLNLSTLPATADHITDLRKQYLIARTPNSQEQMIVSVKHLDTTDQIRNLSEYYNNQTNDARRDQWVQFMAGQIAQHIEDYISDDYTIKEVVIIREENTAQLKKLKNIFEQSARSGLYASHKLVTDINVFVDYLSPLTLLSKKGKAKYGKEK